MEKINYRETKFYRLLKSAELDYIMFNSVQTKTRGKEKYKALERYKDAQDLKAKKDLKHF